MKPLKSLQITLFLMMAISYTSRSQIAIPNPVCYGQPINLYCGGAYGCGFANATYNWSNYSGSWTYIAVGDEYVDPVINQGEDGYAADRFYLQILFSPPPGGNSLGSVNVTMFPEITLIGIPSPVLCWGSSTGSISIEAEGGSPPYSYQWSDGFDTKDISNLSEGFYCVTVSDANNCSVVGCWFVTQPEEISLEATINPVSCQGCNNGSITLSVTGGLPPFSFLWSNGMTSSTISDLYAGSYDVTITDYASCTITRKYTISDPISVCYGQPINLFCGGLYGCGLVNATYRWSNSNGSWQYTTIGDEYVDPVIYPGDDGYATDFFNLSIDFIPPPGGNSTGSIFVNVLPEIVASATISPISCTGQTDGSIGLDVAGGISPYSYYWSNGLTTQNINHLSAGIYTVSITDQAYCLTSESWTISDSPLACQRELKNLNILSGWIKCYNAFYTITVAGNGSNFTVQNGGSATMIAGQNIKYLPGTTVKYGGYMRGYIAPNGPFCLNPSMQDALTGQDEQSSMASEKSSFKVYPNPTTGNFTLELIGEVPAEKVMVDIFGMWGEKVKTEVLSEERKHEISISDKPVGVYFIRIVTSNKSESAKIIKQ